MHGEPGLKFSWNLVGKQKGYENMRMQKIDAEEFKVKPKEMNNPKVGDEIGG